MAHARSEGRATGLDRQAWEAERNPDCRVRSVPEYVFDRRSIIEPRTPEIDRCRCGGLPEGDVD